VSELLDQAAIDAALSGLDGWTGSPDGITRTAELPSFPVAITVVDRVAEAAEEADHHPDIDIRWRTLTFTCATHASTRSSAPHGEPGHVQDHSSSSASRAGPGRAASAGGPAARSPAAAGTPAACSPDPQQEGDTP
jgi:4a-hydroxytetrahydrobiopterin dehydratase